MMNIHKYAHKRLICAAIWSENAFHVGKQTNNTGQNEINVSDEKIKIFKWNQHTNSWFFFLVVAHTKHIYKRWFNE